MPAPKITWAYLEKAILRGDGQGHGAAYKPWIPIRRWNSSPVSTQVPGRLPPFYKRRSFLAFNEWDPARVFAWVGAEVRSQLPAWPWTHLHPLYGLNDDLDRLLPYSDGMQEICINAGIEHGNYPGTRIPFVWTLDLVLTIQVHGSLPRCVVVSVKWIDAERFRNELDPLDRQIEKLEGERRYCKQLLIPFFVTGSDMFPTHLKNNLALLVSASEHPAENSIKNRLLQNFKDRYLDKASLYPVVEWCDWMRVDLGANHANANYVSQYLLWHQIVDCDLTKPLNFSNPPLAGGVAYKNELLARILQ